ncbi:MAG: AAA family ATPase [Prochlorothrix sp.]|nr:AAA family ATPase [Prochlorothrix sp.]
MTQKIAIFNHNGGDSTALITFYLGVELANQGKTVILADTNPQCDLTLLALQQGPKHDDPCLEEIYKTRSNSNIKAALAPAFEAQPKIIEAADCIPVQGQANLLLLPSHVGLTEYEVLLGIAQDLNHASHSLKNLPGAITHLLDTTAERFQADYILIDMSSSLGAINQNLLTTSDFFILPTAVDYLSLLMIESLASILPKWATWAQKVNRLPSFQAVTYPFPDFHLKFLGPIFHNYRFIAGGEFSDFSKRMVTISDLVASRLVPALAKSDMLLLQGGDSNAGVYQYLQTIEIPAFSSLIFASRQSSVPIHQLQAQDFGSSGLVLTSQLQQQREFLTAFEKLATQVIQLTSETHAVCVESV